MHEQLREHLRLARFVLRWLLLCVPLAALVGSAVALFLTSLDYVTQLHWRHPWLLYLLPVAGAVSGWIYRQWGGTAERGNNLILEQIHEPGGGVPARMAPMVLGGTLLTHLFGGSAGREGTAVQMGGSLASTLGALLGLKPHDARILLMAGVAAGFAAVFGTPLAGTIFALEVLTRGKLQYEALVPCLLAAVLSDRVTTAWGVSHTHYDMEFGRDVLQTLNGPLFAKVVVAALAFGLASVLFISGSHGVQRLLRRWVAIDWLRPAVGGAAVVLLTLAVGDRDYLGLGVSAPPAAPHAVTIQSCFREGGAAWSSWWWKLAFTALTVGSGFKGGEVTPLFFIGAALGNTLGVMLGAPVDLMAGLGFVAVFAGATNTPLACTLMAIELFAPGHGGLMESGFVVYAATACFLSYFLSGQTSVYSAQRSLLTDEASPLSPLPDHGERDQG
ncbi:MAG: voltage-gated chloride channel family protein [Pirellulales bacterium]